jgi:predicted outer membrane protein
MRSTYLAVGTAALALTSLAACADNASPTAPKGPAPTAAVAPPVMSSSSTVCLAFTKKQMVAQLKLENARQKNAGVAQLDQLQGEADKLARMSGEACN